jgi:hypothetical protein
MFVNAYPEVSRGFGLRENKPLTYFIGNLIFT